MNWQEIYDIAIEVQELIEEIKNKYNSTTIKDIFNRYNKYYCVEVNFDIRSLKNAVLENKIKNSVIQYNILKKINSNLLNTDQIYQQLPYDLNECQIYIQSLKEECETANSCLDLVIEIDKLSETEYETDKDFKDTEYGKMINYQNQLYEKTLKKTDLLSKVYLSAALNQYFTRLNESEKEHLLMESLSLSYDRNALEFFNKVNMILKTQRTLLVNQEEAHAYYEIYRGLIKIILLENHIMSKSLSEINKSFNIIKNSPQKIKK